MFEATPVPVWIRARSQSLRLREIEDLRVGERAPHVRRLPTPCPQPQPRLLVLLNRARVDEVLDLTEGETGLNLAVDRAVVVP